MVLVSGIWYLVSGIWYLVSGIWDFYTKYDIQDTKYRTKGVNYIIMARSKTKEVLNTTMLVVLTIGVIAGFLGGFLFARDRYDDKIAAISKLNMDKAVTIDSLNAQIQVLGASTKAGEE